MSILSAGELSQILYKDLGVLSVDIELPSGYNEGYRNDPDKLKYNPDLVKKDGDFESGVLVGENSFYDLLEGI